MTTPAGWYPDPAGGQPPALRWWDGTAWTAHVQPAQPAQPAYPAYPAYGGQPAYGLQPTARPAGPTTADGEPLAGWWWRALATVIDSVVLGVVAGLASLPAQIAVQREVATLQRELERDIEAGATPDFGRFFDALPAIYADHVVGLFLAPFLLGAAYHVGFLRWRGATPGKLVCGLRVRPVAAPGRLSWSAIARRYGFQVLVPTAGYVLLLLSGSIALLLLGVLALAAYALGDALWAAGERRRALHDLVAGTVVVTTRT